MLATDKRLMQQWSGLKYVPIQQVMDSILTMLAAEISSEPQTTFGVLVPYATTPVLRYTVLRNQMISRKLRQTNRQ